jgi:hypothetical protein
MFQIVNFISDEENGSLVPIFDVLMASKNLAYFLDVSLTSGLMIETIHVSRMHELMVQIPI